MTDTGDRMRVVVYYAIWATLCAAAAGVVVALIHTWFFSYNPGRSAVIETLFAGIVTALAIAAGQGAVALVTGSLLAQLGRPLSFTVLLGLVIGAFDFVMYFLQMAVPATELGWVPDVIILVAATALITALGARKAGAEEGTTASAG
jgi:hypothetical protein